MCSNPYLRWEPFRWLGRSPFVHTFSVVSELGALTVSARNRTLSTRSIPPARKSPDFAHGVDREISVG